MKICSKCKIEKGLEHYGKKRNNKDGLSYSCKDCVSMENKHYKDINKENTHKYNKEYYSNNKEYFSEKSKVYYVINEEYFSKRSKDYYSNKKEYFSEKSKEYRINNCEKLKEYNKKYIKDYYKIEVNKIKKSEYIKNKKNVDPLYKLKGVIRTSISNSMRQKSYTKKCLTYEILGCHFEEFKIYLENKFEPWMNWNNYGLYNGEVKFGWDLDHIVPISSAINEESLIKLNYFTNFQPLCSYINRNVKRDRLDYKK